MSFPQIAVIWADTEDHTSGHGVRLGSDQPAIVLNPQPGERELSIINLEEAAARSYVPTEGDAGAAMPHDVRRWTERLERAIDKAASEFAEAQRMAYRGDIDVDLPGYASDDPSIRRLAIAIAESRDMAQRLATHGRSRGLDTKAIESLVAQPLVVLSDGIKQQVIPCAETIADNA